MSPLPLLTNRLGPDPRTSPRPGGPSQLDPATCDGLAPSLVEYASVRGADCDEAWLGLISELFSDMCVPLADDDDGDGEGDGGGEGAERAGA